MPKRKLPPNDEVARMYLSGMSNGEIAEKCGVRPITVSSLLRRIGVPGRSAKEAAAVMKERGRENKAKFWLGKKQPRDFVEKRVSKIRGERHYLWKGGKHRRPYRNGVKKEACATCGETASLGIHHKDFDHYNDNPDNLQVLCVSCHMSIHKKAYWDAIHADKEPPKSNGPIGWRHDK